MGIDFQPVKPSKDAPLRADGKVKWGRYSLSGWSKLWCLLIDHGVDTSEFSVSNNGHRVKASTCKKVADVIEANFDKYVATQGGSPTNADDIEVCKLDILLWRTCGGYRQY